VTGTPILGPRPAFSRLRKALARANRPGALLAEGPANPASTRTRAIDTTDLDAFVHGSGRQLGAGRLHLRALAPTGQPGRCPRAGRTIPGRLITGHTPGLLPQSAPLGIAGAATRGWITARSLEAPKRLQTVAQPSGPRSGPSPPASPCRNRASLQQAWGTQHRLRSGIVDGEGAHPGPAAAAS